MVASIIMTPSPKRSVKLEPADTSAQPVPTSVGETADAKKNDSSYFTATLTTLKCQICPFKTSKQAAMVRHMKNNHVICEEKLESLHRDITSPVVFEKICIVPMSFLTECSKKMKQV